MENAATWLITTIMTFFSRFFASPAPVECRHDDLIALINRLLDENKQLQERLLPTPEVTTAQPADNNTKKADAIVGWRPPRQRVRDFIQMTEPAASLPLLSPDDLQFLENSRQ